MLKRVLVIGLFMASSLFGLNQAMINISDLDAEIGVDFDLGQFQEDYAVDTYFLGVGYLSTDDGAGKSLVSGKMIIVNDLPESDNTRLGVGMKVISTEEGAETFLATPMGAILDVGLSDEKPLYWKSELFYAPGALSYKDARSYFSARTGIYFEAIENVRLFFEGRYIQTKYQIAGTVEFNKSLYGGAVVGF